MGKSLGDVLARIEQNRGRSHTKALAVKTELEDEINLLPQWSDSVRRIPNFALRSALFAATNKGRRPYLERVRIKALGGIELIYTGSLLDQNDLDVWQTVLHCSRAQKMGPACRVTAYRLLMLLGKTDTGKNRAILDRQLSRMSATSLQVRVGECSYEGSLIQEVYRDHETGAYLIRLNPRLRNLFVGDQFTDADWAIRTALRGRPLAQWLDGFYATHARPFDLKIETLHSLCGSRASRLTDFKKDLLRALDFVKIAREAADRPFEYAIDAGLVRVKSTPTAAQRRHLLGSR
jgi:hypothetical protein